jgi:orotidine-5'-phosphate decarboxylase
MESLKKTIDYIPEDILTIADAKRGDIGNTSKLYAQSFFEYYHADALTVAPYMGSDSVLPFLEYKDKWVIILGLTSNDGSLDFQHQQLVNGEKLFSKVIATCATYGTKDQIMFVIGATQADQIKQIRTLVPDHFFLVPGVGAQGGNLQDVCTNGLNSEVGLIVNASRSIIYANSGLNFAESARSKALELQKEMAIILNRRF